MNDLSRTKPFLLLSALALFIAILPVWPYGYYTLLRFLVCGTSVYLAIVFYAQKKTAWIYGFSFIAVLFNPLIVIHLEKALWVVIDLLTAGVFIYLIACNWKKERR